MMRVITNPRPADWNTCGQAAIASLLVHFRLGPFADAVPDDDGAAIDAVRVRFGPDVPFGYGTSAFRIAAALRAHGLSAEITHSGWFGGGAARALERLSAHLSRGIPVPVCLDDAELGGRPWSAHWALALGLEGEHIQLGNAGVRRLSLARFLSAWRCRHLPPPHHYCAVLASQPRS
jgi:hypothetical protein